jgi:hypothetical protein
MSSGEKLAKRFCVAQCVGNPGKEVPYEPDENVSFKKCTKKRDCPCIRVVEHDGRFKLCWYPLRNSGVSDHELAEFWAWI